MIDLQHITMTEVVLGVMLGTVMIVADRRRTKSYNSFTARRTKEFFKP